jgi:hypothetical protein
MHNIFYCDFCVLGSYRLNSTSVLFIATWFGVTVEAQLLSNIYIVLNQLNYRIEFSGDLVDRISYFALQGNDAWLVEIFSSKYNPSSTGKVFW